MFSIEVPYFNLNHIYDSGQVPRWIKIKESKYIVIHKNKALKIEQQRNRFDWNKQRLIMNCSEEDFFDIWFEYFDLRMDCLDINMKVKNLGRKFKIPANKGNGIHIIQQDEFEAYVLTKLIKYVGYEKAAIAMNHIAEKCGIKHIQSMKEAGKVTWYEWPTPEIILNKHNKLARMGKINAWLKKLCEAIVKDGYAYYESNDKLFRLFGMHDVSQFPTARIEDTIAKNFEKNPEEFSSLYLSDINEKGIVYMYIVHHILTKRKEAKIFGVNR